MVYDKQKILSGSGPWFVAQKNLEPDEDDEELHTFYNLHDPMSYYRCQIPVLLGKRIRGCFHGCWVLLSSNRPRNSMHWSLWNPFTSQILNLPPFIPLDISYCCLSAPPEHPNSVLYLTRTKHPEIIFYRVGNALNSRIRLRWGHHACVLNGATNKYDSSFHFLTCCNSKVYALFRVFIMRKATYMLVELNAEVKNKEGDDLSVLVVCKVPSPPGDVDSFIVSILKGSSTQLFFIVLVLMEDTCITTTSPVSHVYVFKLDMNNKTWEEMEDLKDIIFSVELEIPDCNSEVLLSVGTPKAVSTIYSPAVNASSELGGYVHILADKGKIVYSYHVKDKTLSISCIPCLSGTNYHQVSAWAMLTSSRFERDADCKQGKEVCHKEDEILSVKGNDDLGFPFRALKMKEFYGDRTESENADDFKQGDKDVNIIVRGLGDDESHLLNLPLHVLGVLMKEFCVGVEYLKFRSTCKHCYLAAPLTPSWHNNSGKYHSPWLIVFDKHKGIITFTDPMFGDKYFIKTPQELICDLEIKCCRNGWLLIKKSISGSLVFYNPFTSDIRELPQLHNPNILSFSAPPTSPDCIVVGNTEDTRRNRFYIHHFVGGEVGPSLWSVTHLTLWSVTHLNILHGGYTFPQLTFYGQDLYSLREDRGLDVFEEIGFREDLSWKRNVAKAPPTSSFPQQSFLLRCDQHDLLHVMVGKLGESIEVYKLNNNVSDSSSTHKEWVKINSLGRHMIFICGTSSHCIDAKTPHMENKIYFPRLPSDQNVSSNYNDIVFYSLETCRYHTFNQGTFADFFGTKHFLDPHAWIEPTWF